MSQFWINSVLPSIKEAGRIVTLGRLGAGSVALVAALMVSCTSQGGQSAANSPYEVQLANHLRETGATMYGAYWCPHCAEQKDLFDGAADQLPYVECDPNGENPQPQLCRDKGVKGYPTWEIGGQLYPGTRSLDELADLSGFPTKQSP